MKRVSKLTFLLVAVIMVMQVLIPTISVAVLIDNPEGYDTSSIKLKIQDVRPYSDDDGNGARDDIYTFFANSANQTAFKIGDYAGGALSFNNLYYCLKWGLGFGAGETPANGVDYNYKTNIKNDDTGIANISQIRWIADNMYVPNSEGSSALRARLLSRAGITSSELTDDDIDVVQQFALWYYTQNSGDLLYGELRADGFDLGKGLLAIHGNQYSDSEIDTFTTTRAEQMTTLYRYLINNASNAMEEEPEIVLTKTGATITEETLAGENVIKVGPFKIDANNNNYFNFSYGIKYKESADGEWKTLDTSNTSYYILDNSHTTLTTAGENYNLKNEINNGEFYIAIIKDDEFVTTPISNITNFELSISYDYYNTIATMWTAGNEDQPVLKVEKVKENDSSSVEVGVQPQGTYDIILIKEDENGEELNSTATFEVNGVTKQVTGHLIVADDVEINAGNVGTADVYTIKETVPPDGYCEFDGIITITVNKKLEGTTYVVDSIEYVVKGSNGHDITNDVDNEKVYLKNGNIYVEVKNYEEEQPVFDLSLRKFITKTNGTELTGSNDRTPVISLSGLRNVSRTTAVYEHSKTPIYLKRGDIITYTIRVYNEGEVDGYVKEITDYLCDGLEFVEGSAVNNTYGWVLGDDGKTVKTTYLKDTLLKAYDKNMTEDEANRNNSVWQKAADGTDGLYYADVQIECRISEDANVNITLPNVAEISDDYNDQNIPDRDSTPDSLREDDIRNYENNPWYQDDDDYERVIIEPDKVFDLALRKYITELNGVTLEDSREPSIDTSKLDAGTSKTAEYAHRKDPVEVKTGDIVTYSITIYNEGEAEGRATKIVDQLPRGLRFVEVVSGNYELSSYDENTNKLTLVETEANTNLQAKETGRPSDCTTIKINCEVVVPVEKNNQVLTNIAYISEEYNAETGVTITTQTREDRDSEPGTKPNKTADELKTEDTGYTGKDNYTMDELSNEDKYYEGQQDDDDFEKVIIKGRTFDLSLRKYITKVNGEDVETRTPDINVDGLDGITNTTAEYAHRKDPVEVETGDKVIYSITVYNEGEISGRATKIVDQLPTGMRFVRVVSGNYEKETYNEETNTLVLVETERNEDLEPFNSDTKVLDSTTVEIECEIVAPVEKNNQVLTNIAYISEEYNAETEVTITTQTGEDRDSEPGTKPNKTADELKTEDTGYTGKDNYTMDELSNEDKYYEGQQDDDDFEKVIIKPKEFDLSLRKFISSLERKGEDVNLDSREPNVDTDILESTTTAKYTHPKNSVTVKQGDIITYTIRVYNEGELDGYAKEITDYLPYGLGFLNGYSNNGAWLIASENVETQPLVGENGWFANKASITSSLLADEDVDNIMIITGKNAEGLKLTNNALEDELIVKYDAENNVLSYKEVTVTCIVLAPNTYEGALVNIAEISNDQAIQIINNEEVEVDIPDRDSKPDNADLDNYELKEDNSTYQEDDDDYEPVELKFFDLALRKFITGVNEEKVTTRIPEFYIDEQGNYKYRHSKDPVLVMDKDVVTYTIRIFNEGTMEGYAEEIEDDIPDGLIFLPDNQTNTSYRWKMYYYDETGTLVETDDVEKAEVIRTDYLSEANGTIDPETNTNSNLLKKFDKDNMKTPDYRDVKVAFKVTQKAMPEDKIIINKAQITEDSDDDEDSIPDEWNEGEDDQDIEKIYVKEFDLALYKWITETRVNVDGKSTTTETGFKPNIGKTEGSGDKYRDNNEAEPIASVVIDKRKIQSTVVKFVYNIKVVNEGDIEGYATEVTDYIPEGLEFVAEDNPLWTIGEKDGTIVTRALETVLLKPGQSATIPVIFTWKKDANNLGLKKNIAAITEDYNEYGIEDIDSTPKNEKAKDYDKEQEDDDDYALVILTLKTGGEISYLGIVVGVISIIAAGAITIKKYVL